MNEINIQSLIIDKEDFQNAQFYFSLKGIDLYMHVIQIFKSKFKEESFNYKEISSFIRYDKSLRIQLFGYLACIEEGLRSKFLIKKDITSNDMNSDFNKINFIDRQNINKTSNLYFYIIKNKIDFRKVIKLCSKNKLLAKNDFKSLNKLIDFRNNIMHHNLILIKDASKWSDVDKNINEIKEIIAILSKYLPKKYQKGFINSLNKLSNNKAKYFTRINLGEL